MPKVTANNCEMFYEIDDYTDPWRNAPYILLQHGFGRSSKFWYRCVPYLARFYKIIRPDLRGETHLRAWMLREARAANRVDHAHIIDIHDIGETEEGEL